MKKKLTVVAALVLVLAMGVGGTLAYLTDKSATVTNTFTVGNVKISLVETTGSEYKMVPGNKIAKDPKVTVGATSEDCYLFVKLDKSSNFDDFFENFVLADGWTVGTGTGTGGNGVPTDVCYREDAKANDSFYVLASGGDGYANGYVQVKGTVTQGMMDAISDENNEDATEPTLEITAYAVQKANVASAKAAWDALNPTTSD